MVRYSLCQTAAEITSCQHPGAHFFGWYTTAATTAVEHAIANGRSVSTKCAGASVFERSVRDWDQETITSLTPAVMCFCGGCRIRLLCRIASCNSSWTISSCAVNCRDEAFGTTSVHELHRVAWYSLSPRVYPRQMTCVRDLTKSVLNTTRNTQPKCSFSKVFHSHRYFTTAGVEIAWFVFLC